MIPILFVRYAPGSCGTFFLSLLQTSSQVACWDLELEKLKGKPEFAEKFLLWFSTRFVSDLDNHIKHEPHHPYKLDFLSAKHPRGDDIDEPTLIKLLTERQDHLFLDNINNNKITAMRLCKGVIPQFGQGNHSVSIVIDRPSYRWLHRIRWVKLFGKENGNWINKESHPDFLKIKYSNSNFNNKYYFDCTWREFAKNFIINEPVMEVFRNPEKLLSDPSNALCTHHLVNLSTILTPELGVQTIVELFKKLSLGDCDVDLIQKCYEHYRRTNLEPFSKFLPK